MENRELLANISQDFYFNELTIGDLADKYQLSRYLVNKYLDDARKSGIVTINIASPTARDHELEQQFKEIFSIPNIYVVKENELAEGNHENFIKFAAEKIETAIKDSSIVGTTWGGTIFNLIEHFNDSSVPHLAFTQFVGENRKYNSAAGSMRMVEKVANKFSARYVTLSGPLYIINDAVRRGLKNEISSLEAFESSRQMDLIFSSLGTLASINSIDTWRQNINDIFPDVNFGDIAGLAYGRAYDVHGHFLNRNHDRVFGQDLETILATPKRIVVVKSKFKTQATLGALRGGLFTDYIITESIARRILAEL